MSDKIEPDVDQEIVTQDPGSENGREDFNPAGSRLTRRQVLALPILAVAPNITQGAHNAGISESTLRRWRKNEHFRRELDRLTSETADLTRLQLESLTKQSSQVLSDLMQSPDPMVQLRAARAVAALGVQVTRGQDALH